MKNCTSLDDPYRFFNIKDQTYSTGLTGSPGFSYSSVDNLPTQVAPEASEYFGSKLMPFVKALLHASDSTKSLQNLFSEKLQPEIANAIIASDGKLAPRYENIEQLRKSNDSGQKKVLVLGAGMVTGPLISYRQNKKCVKILKIVFFSKNGVWYLFLPRSMSMPRRVLF